MEVKSDRLKRRILQQLQLPERPVKILLQQTSAVSPAVLFTAGFGAKLPQSSEYGELRPLVA